MTKIELENILNILIEENVKQDNQIRADLWRRNLQYLAKQSDDYNIDRATVGMTQACRGIMSWGHFTDAEGDGMVTILGHANNVDVDALEHPKRSFWQNFWRKVGF